MSREALILSAVAARLDAGTYAPRTARQPSHVPPAIVRRARFAAAAEAAREVAGPLLSCAAVAAVAALIFLA